MVAARAGQVGAKVDGRDPLAVLTYGKSEESSATRAEAAERAPDGTVALRAPMQGTIVSVESVIGSAVRPGQVVLVMETVKMEHEIRSEVGGTIRELTVRVGDTVFDGHTLAYIEQDAALNVSTQSEETVDLDQRIGRITQLLVNGAEYAATTQRSRDGC